MLEAISNTSPLLYLYRVGVIEWLPKLFHEIWITPAVVQELQEGRRKGYNVPNPDKYGWLQVFAPHATPFEWLSLDLGAGELTAMALALENSSRIILLDDLVARRTAQAAGLTVWGTLRVVLEAKSQGLIAQMAPLLDDLSAGGLWMSDDIRRRVLALAGE